MHDKRDDFSFHVKYKRTDALLHITNFPFLSNDILSFPAYDVLSHSLCDMPELVFHMNGIFYSDAQC